MNLFRKGSAANLHAPDVRVLRVEVIEARNLVASTKAGDSDPNIALYLVDLGNREIKTESFKTKPQSKTLNPKWNENFTFGALSILFPCTIDNTNILFLTYTLTSRIFRQEIQSGQRRRAAQSSLGGVPPGWLLHV